MPEAPPADGDQEQAEAADPPTALADRTEAADGKNTTRSFSLGPLALAFAAAGVVGSLGAGAVFSQHRRRNQLSPPE